MAPRTTTLVLLLALLSVAHASDQLADSLKANTKGLVTKSSEVAAFLKKVDETNIAETGPEVFGLLAGVAEAYYNAASDLHGVQIPEDFDLSEADAAAIQANLAALVLAQKDISGELTKKVGLFVKDHYDGPILLVLEDLREVVLKTYVPELPRFWQLELPSKILKRQLEYLLTKAVKAYTPAEVSVQ
jgi:hypothetical protein